MPVWVIKRAECIFSHFFQPHCSLTFFFCPHFVIANLSLNCARSQKKKKNVRCCYHDVECDFNLEPKRIAFVAVMLYPTLIRLRPPSGSSRLFPWWVSQLWSENCASTLVTPVSFSSWPWLMYCSHYMLVPPACSLCSALKLCHCLPLPLDSAQVWAASVSTTCASSCWSVASGGWRIRSICCRSSLVSRSHSALAEGRREGENLKLWSECVLIEAAVLNPFPGQFYKWSILFAVFEILYLE